MNDDKQKQVATPAVGGERERERIARIIDPGGMSDGIRRRWAFEKADAILAPGTARRRRKDSK